MKTVTQNSMICYTYNTKLCKSLEPNRKRIQSCFYNYHSNKLLCYGKQGISKNELFTILCHSLQYFSVLKLRNGILSYAIHAIP